MKKSFFTALFHDTHPLGVKASMAFIFATRPRTNVSRLCEMKDSLLLFLCLSYSSCCIYILLLPVFVVLTPTTTTIFTFHLCGCMSECLCGRIQFHFGKFSSMKLHNTEYIFIVKVWRFIPFVNLHLQQQQ